MLCGNWIKDLADKRLAKHGNDLRKAELEGIANARAPDFFRRLCKRMEEDVGAYLSTPRSFPIRFQSVSDQVFEIRHGEYPTFYLRLTIEADGIAFLFTTKAPGRIRKRIAFSSLPLGPIKSTIPLKATRLPTKGTYRNCC